MNPAGAGALQRHYPIDVGEAGEINNAAATDVAGAAAGRVLQTDLPADLPQDDEASLPTLELARDPVLAMVSRVLGERLSTDNLAWRGDPVPVMRSLQKMLVAHSLTLAEGQRQPAMGAIRAVELAVRWRLRWMQMRRSEAESHFIQPQQDQDATHKSA